jgi:hypothetical protein
MGDGCSLIEETQILVQLQAAPLGLSELGSLLNVQEAPINGVLLAILSFRSLVILRLRQALLISSLQRKC